jgi:hypothetical protein
MVVLERLFTRVLAFVNRSLFLGMSHLTDFLQLCVVQIHLETTWYPVHYYRQKRPWINRDGSEN